MSFYNMAIGKKGYCLVPGHDTQHVLTLDCWSELRRFLYGNDNYNSYVQACKDKPKK